MTIAGDEASETGSSTDDNSRTMIATGDFNENYTKRYIFNFGFESCDFICVSCEVIAFGFKSANICYAKSINYGHANLQT